MGQAQRPVASIEFARSQNVGIVVRIYYQSNSGNLSATFFWDGLVDLTLGHGPRYLLATLACRPADGQPQQDTVLAATKWSMRRYMRHDGIYSQGSSNSCSTRCV